MRGTINFKSTVGVGSTFTISLPIRHTKEKALSVTASLVRSGSLNSGSKGSSILSSLKDEHTLDSRRLRTRNLSPARRSLASNEKKNSHSEIPRVVGFSIPYIADSNSMYDSHHTERGNPASRLLSRVAGGDMDGTLDTDSDSTTKMKNPGFKRRKK